MQVSRSASQADIKRAFRGLALQYHPDVNSADDAQECFRQIVDAYEVLSDSSARAIYDREGTTGLARPGARPAQGAAEIYWQEFKPAKRAGNSRKFQARDAAAAASSSFVAEGEALPVTVGSVVEYPLREHEVRAGRTHGVGFVVDRNADRGDAERLPAERMSLCEVEPLWQPDDEACSASGCWMSDELEGSAFEKEEDMRVLRSTFVRGRGLAAPEHFFIHDDISEKAGGQDASSAVIFV
ncbi:unnamed protein product [Polarella glacialis]|uniref:J domain-containing protein n=1 Tax=Polarella glacialis TaxID=89957 RepID=A0A813FL18_POLGL|nr:unnamed protein product [Polarella glacialis]